MGLLFIGFAVGIVVAFLLRTLLQYERDGLARVGDGLTRLESAVQELDERVQALEVIAASGDQPVYDRTSEPASTSSESPRNRART